MPLIEGIEFKDDYGSIHPQDSRLWLELFKLAEQRHPGRDLWSRLMYVRNTGAVLEPSREYGYVIKPVYGMYGFSSAAEYEKERQCLNKYRTEIIEMLGELRK